MHHHLLIIVALVLMACSCHAAEAFRESFDGGKAPGWDGPGVFEAASGRGQVLHITQAAPAGEQRSVLNIPVPIEAVRGSFVVFGADVRMQAVSAKPVSWMGVKVMLVIETPKGRQYPQAEIPVGDSDWKSYSSRSTTVPEDAISATLVLGLENVSGDVWFDNARVSVRKKIVKAPAADPAKPIYRGHDLPRLRGAMVSRMIAEADFVEFADRWNGNLIRWPLVQVGQQPPEIAAYDAWLDGELARLDQVLTWAGKHGVKVVLDMHSPPGGEANPGGYVAAYGRIFSAPEAQQAFIQAWQKMAQRYKGRPEIWGFDLMNEPEDHRSLAEGCDDWQDLAAKTAKAIHAIDPERTLIIEPPLGGDPREFATFQPLDEPRVVYSFHMYLPHTITHQGVFGPSAGFTYPGEADGRRWDKAALEAVIQPAVDFAERYRVHMFVGEFSCIRTAPGDTAVSYMRDVIDIIEARGWDWTYHAYREWEGWSVEHTGPLDQPTMTSEPGPSQKLVLQWLAANQKP